MFKTAIKFVVLIPLALIAIVLSVANRHVVSLAFNPFNPADQVLAISLPFFVFLFLAVMLGVLIGAVATWWSQGKWRKQARDEAHAARRHREEADKLKTRVEELTAKTLIAASK